MNLYYLRKPIDKKKYIHRFPKNIEQKTIKVYSEIPLRKTCFTKANRICFERFLCLDILVTKTFERIRKT